MAHPMAYALVPIGIGLKPSVPLLRRVRRTTHAQVAQHSTIADGALALNLACKAQALARPMVNVTVQTGTGTFPVVAL